MCAEVKNLFGYVARRVGTFGGDFLRQLACGDNVFNLTA